MIIIVNAMPCTIFFFDQNNGTNDLPTGISAAKSIGFQCMMRSLYFMQWDFVVAVVVVVVVIIIFNSIVFYSPFHVVHIKIAHNSNQYYFDYYIYGYANENVCVCVCVCECSFGFWFLMRDAIQKC